MSASKPINPGTVFLIVIISMIVSWFGFSFLSWPSSKGQEPGRFEFLQPDLTNDDVNLDPIFNDSICADQDCDTTSVKQYRNDFNKSKRDLNAQEGMWRAANALVFLTFLQVFVVATTLWYLRETFKTQREELLIAIKSAENAEKFQIPQVMVSIHPKFAGMKGSEQTDLAITFDAKNYGNTPARNIQVTAVVDVEDKSRNCNEKEIDYSQIRQFAILDDNPMYPSELHCVSVDCPVLAYRETTAKTSLGTIPMNQVLDVLTAQVESNLRVLTTCTYMDLVSDKVYTTDTVYEIGVRAASEEWAYEYRLMIHQPGTPVSKEEYVGQLEDQITVRAIYRASRTENDS